MSNQNLHYGTIVLIILIFIILFLLNITVVNITIGVLLTLLFFYLFLNSLNKKIAVSELISLICFLQLVFFSILNRFSFDNFGIYISFILPSALIFLLSFNIGLKKIIINRDLVLTTLKNNKNLNFILLLVWVGIFSLILNVFDFYFLDAFTYIGFCFSFLLITYKKKYFFYVFIYLVLILLNCIIVAVFGNLIFAGFLCVLFIPYIFKFNKKKILITILISFFLLNIFQSVKHVYRSMVWEDDQRKYDINLFVDSFFSDNDQDSMSTLERANSGLVISWIYDYVPNRYPHLYGENLVDDLSNALLPRILFPNKKDIDTRLNYMRYTGRWTPEGNSVGINVFGISYAEFGFVLSLLFLFFLGRILNLIFNYLIILFNSKNRYHILLFLIPTIFLSFVKFEQEFVQQLAGFLRTLIIIILIYNFYKFLNSKAL